MPFDFNIQLSAPGCQGVKKTPVKGSAIPGLRRSYRPEKVQYLFIGESMPAGGKFFYHANSNLYRYTAEAFRQVVPDFGKTDFLNAFKAAGFYLDDLCDEPVNNLGSKERKCKCRLYEEDLTERLKLYQPEMIFVTPKAIGENVKRSVAAAGLRGVPVLEMPFPAMSWQEKYVATLANALRDILPAE